MKIEYQDRIDDYLLNRMSDEEREKFEAEIAANEELREQLAFVESVNQVSKSRSEKLTAIEEWRNDYMWGNYKKKRELRIRRMLYWSSGVAAVVIVGFFLFRTSSQSNSTFGTKDNEIDYCPNVTYGNVSPNSNSVKEMLAAGQFEDALAMVEKKEMGIAQELMRLDNRDVNDEDLEKRRQSLKIQLDELQWDKAQALLGLCDYVGAMAVLDEIRKSESVYRESADSLIELLQRE